MSHGCRRCFRYGSEAQKLLAAERLLIDAEAERDALAAKLAEMQALTINVNGHQHWGMLLFESLGKFLEQVATGDGPLSTTIDVKFTDVQFPAVHLWATTDDKEPAARCAELAAARRALEVTVEQLRAALATSEAAREMHQLHAEGELAAQGRELDKVRAEAADMREERDEAIFVLNRLHSLHLNEAHTDPGQPQYDAAVLLARWAQRDALAALAPSPRDKTGDPSNNVTE